MSVDNIRYAFEHRILPNLVYENPLAFIGAMLDNSDLLFESLDDMISNEGFINPYKKEDFGVYPFKISDDIRALCINFPQPEREPLCYRSYIMFDNELKNIRFFCIEKGGIDATDYAFVCSWTQDGTHVNYGTCSIEIEEELKYCEEVFVEYLE